MENTFMIDNHIMIILRERERERGGERNIE